MRHAGLLTTAAIVCYGAPAAAAYTRAAPVVGVRRHIRRPDGLAITFDDGPQPGATERFLEALDGLGVRSTFFVVGEQVRRFPHLLRAVRAAGHEIGNHGYRHRNHFLRHPFEVIRDMKRGAEAIADAIGEYPQLFRPPQGSVTAATLMAARRMDSVIVLWSAWGRDWRSTASADTIAHDALRGARGGGILLLHDADYYSERTWHGTFEALPRIIAEIRRRGLVPRAIGGRAGLAHRC